eukprot:GHVR01181526.1.p1 GENE.GHVR01181526.1~~GHVR01181526.1.p1  ORF type:complete len:126 (+),score=7.81 GHVR01181526.1:737-1114(+)
MICDIVMSDMGKTRLHLKKINKTRYTNNVNLHQYVLTPEGVHCDTTCPLCKLKLPKEGFPKESIGVSCWHCKLCESIHIQNNFEDYLEDLRCDAIDRQYLENDFEDYLEDLRCDAIDRQYLENDF